MTYHLQPLSEFLEDVRDRAARHNAPPLFIDKLDELIGLHQGKTIEERIEEAHNEGYDESEKENAETIRELQSENDALAKRVADLEAEIDDMRERNGLDIIA